MGNAIAVRCADGVVVGAGKDKLIDGTSVVLTTSIVKGDGWVVASAGVAIPEPIGQRCSVLPDVVRVLGNARLDTLDVRKRLAADFPSSGAHEATELLVVSRNALPESEGNAWYIHIAVLDATTVLTSFSEDVLTDTTTVKVRRAMDGNPVALHVGDNGELRRLVDANAYNSGIEDVLPPRAAADLSPAEAQTWITAMFTQALPNTPIDLVYLPYIDR